MENLMRSQRSEKGRAGGRVAALHGGCRGGTGVGLPTAPSPELRPGAELHCSFHLSKPGIWLDPAIS